MNSRTRQRLRDVLVWFLMIVLLASVGCGADMAGGTPIEYVIDRDELDFLVEDGLDDTIPVIMPEKLELFALKNHRRQLAQTMAVKVDEALAPFALLLTFFAIEGAEDVILAIAPIDKLRRVRRIFNEVRELRKQKKRAKKLEKLADELKDLTGRELDELKQMIEPLAKTELRALRKIRKATKSPKVTHKLLWQHINREADITWIAKQLNKRKIDEDFVRRFTFDGDWVREFSEHEAHPSWEDLRKTVNNTVDQGVRDSLASKVTGLLGEQAAAKIMAGRGFRKRFFDGDRREPLIERGIGYGGNRSLDIVASGEQRVVFAEVKNWSSGTWNDVSKRNGIEEQLTRHNEGIDDILTNKSYTEEPAKLLMVRKEGYEGLLDDDRKKFEKAIDSLGWTIELIPGEQIPDFSDLIRNLQ